MNKKSNELVALEWLLAPLNEQINSIHNAWQSAQNPTDFVAIKNDFHVIGNILKIANLTAFSELAVALKVVSNALSTGKLDMSVAQKAFYASKLLQHELNRFVLTGFDHKGLITLKTHYLSYLLQSAGDDYADIERAIDGRFSEQLPLIEEEALRLNDENYEKLSQAFYQATKSLLDSNTNDGEHLGNLLKVVGYLRKSAGDNALKNLWYMTGLWLSSLMSNDEPLPQSYIQLLYQLHQVIELQQNFVSDVSSAIWIENLLIDIYVQLSELQTATQETHELLAILNSGLVSEQAFFPHILSILEGVLFGLSKGEIFAEVLEDVKERLMVRGWSFYEQYVSQIIEDIKVSKQSPELFSQMQWQINTQLQDLYASIQSTHEAIENKIGESIASLPNTPESNIDPLRRVRILVEEIKYAFNDYLHSKDLTALPKKADFEELDQMFGDMGMYDVAQISKRLYDLFDELYTKNPSRISWQFAHATADGLSLLEMFLDSLVKQVFDNALLRRASERLEQASQTLNDSQIVDEFDDSKVVDDQVRYDDTGEVSADDNQTAPQTQDGLTQEIQAMPVQSELNEPSFDSPVVLSQDYIVAKDGLKPDDFDVDEDIQEIFSEEVKEVVADVGELLPQWKRDPKNLNPLKDIRRGFHTLKGSGRMVGAFSIGELAWAVENMLNRVLDGTVVASTQIVDFVAQTLELIPTLVADFEQKNPPSIDPAVTVLKANNILAGKEIDYGLPSVADYHLTDQTVQDTTADTQTTQIDDIDGIEDAQVIDDTNINDTHTADNPSIALPDVLLEFIHNAKQPPQNVNRDPVDDDIKEIYIEETDEVLGEIVPLFDEWRSNTADMATLTNIRRGFHTLKGSGRMVGAGELGELAWAVENMLNRVLDGTVAINDGMIALIQAVLDEFADLVKIFEIGSSDYPDITTLQIATAHAYSKGLGDKFDYREVQTLYQTNDNTQDNINTQNNADSATTQTALSETSPVPSDDEEARLCEIFIEEAKELVSSIKAYLNKHAHANKLVVSDEIVRAFHTLRSASGLSPLTAIGEIGAMAEHSLQNLQKHDEPMTAEHLSALGEAVSLIESHLDNYDKNVQVSQSTTHELSDEKSRIEELLVDKTNDKTFDVAQLIDGIDELLDAQLELESVAGKSQEVIQNYATTLLEEIELLESRTTQSGKFQRLLTSLSYGYQVLFNHPAVASDDEFIDGLMACHGELIGLFDSLAGSMSLRLNEQVLTALSNKVADIQEYYRGLESHALVTDSHDSDLSEVLPIEFQEVTTDDDLLEIFLEEASELDEAIGTAFSVWRNDTTNTEALKELQRHLHTIKGGARLAGISSIGDLTHEAETIYEQMVDGRLTPSDGWVKVMQGVQDILSLQIDEVRQNKRAFFASQAVAELRQFLSAGEVPEGASISLPVLVEETANKDDVSEQSDEPKSDFEIRRQRSWQGQLPDEDILAVFLEEAEDIVVSSTDDFQVFKSNTGDIATLQKLQRKLHTIKGGARMVSANGVADLAHNMETVYEDLGTRRRPATRMVTQLLLACHDWLAQAMTLLNARINPPRPAPLIDALDNFSHRPDGLVEVPMVTLSEELDLIAMHEAQEKQRRGGHDISRMPPMTGLFGETEDATNNNEMIRISAGLMERMINLSGEAAINRARIDMSMTSLTASIEEMGATVQRLHDQLRRMDIELEAQILAQIDDKILIDSGEFDPLEMDQYSSLNQLSKSLSESASDLLDLKATLLEKTRDGENLLLQLSRTQTELQDGLMNSRMVPFSRLTPRLQRIVRQISAELGKNVELSVVNADDEMDRTILERITSPLEHMLRNAIDHGIELPDERATIGKSRMGHIVLEVVREGSEVLIHLTDDGAGINVDAVRKKAISQGLINANDQTLTDLDIMQYIFNAGLSTTSVVTQISGRGVGMDVVRSEIRQLGGSVSVDSVRGQGSKFTMRVPLTVAVSDALVVRVADRHYGIPLVQIDRVTQVSPKALLEYYQSSQSTMLIDNQEYRLRYLNEILSGHNFSELMNANTSLPVITIKNQAGQNIALQVDEIIGSRIEVVVKPLGRQLSHVAGISAATIMGDGSVMLILDLMALVRNAQARVAIQIEEPAENRRPVVMVVDDSVTVRKVTSRFLERQGFEPVVAKDGVDAIEILQELTPDLMLLDIEMPRMDGFEVATQVRHNQRLKDLPIIMITSRTGEKHRERAFEIGVTDYMGKPFQENDLLNRITALLPQSLLQK